MFDGLEIAMTVAPLTAAAPLRAAAPSSSSFGAVLRAQAVANPRPASAPPGAAHAALASVERARERLETVLAAARRGRTFSAGELLALQADAYRYAQTVELASKVVEHGAQALKQAVNTQV